MTLPNVYDSMVLTFYLDNEIKNYIINLDSIKIVNLKNKTRLELINTKRQKEWPINPKGLGICITDDPSINHAGDWMNMGCSRILYIIKDVKVLKKKTFVAIGDLVSKSVIIPERIPQNDNHPANLYI